MGQRMRSQTKHCSPCSPLLLGLPMLPPSPPARVARALMPASHRQPPEHTFGTPDWTDCTGAWRFPYVIMHSII